MIHLLAWCSKHGVRADVQPLQMRSVPMNAGIKGHLFEWLNPRWNHTHAAGKNPSFSVGFFFCFRGRWEKQEYFFVCDERWTRADHKENETHTHTHTHREKDGWTKRTHTHTLSPLSFPNLCLSRFESNFKATRGWKSLCCVGWKLLLSLLVTLRSTPERQKMKRPISSFIPRSPSQGGSALLHSPVNFCGQ